MPEHYELYLKCTSILQQMLSTLGIMYLIRGLATCSLQLQFIVNYQQHLKGSCIFLAGFQVDPLCKLNRNLEKKNLEKTLTER